MSGRTRALAAEDDALPPASPMRPCRAARRFRPADRTRPAR